MASSKAYLAVVSAYTIEKFQYRLDNLCINEETDMGRVWNMIILASVYMHTYVLRMITNLRLYSVA